jgi:uncharacterized membrane protein
MIRKDTHRSTVDVGIRQPDINDITKRNVELIAQMEAAFDQRRSVGDRVADLVAAWVGSWAFLIAQSILLVTWMALNIVAWRQHWDPYPFILLNLVLSFQAAFATPIILMSQNRQGRLSERRNHLDLQINLLAEQENTEQLRLLRLLCAKAGIGQEGPGQALEETTRPDDIFRQIGESADIKNHGRSST